MTDGFPASGTVDLAAPLATSNIPPAGTPVPLVVSDLAQGGEIRPVWRNEAGGVTFELPGLGLFVKWTPAEVFPHDVAEVATEANRLRWAARFTPVPRVVQTGTDDEGSWMVTVALPGASAVSPRWLADPHPAVRAIGGGLRELHDRLPVTGCPFSWSAAERLARVRTRILASASQEGSDPATTEAALATVERLAEQPPTDLLVVCHGDACAPNTLLDDEGRWTGHVDLGRLGLADRWADLAVATMSLGWNYGSGWEETFWAAYGIEPDAERIAYYQALWNA